MNTNNSNISPLQATRDLYREVIRQTLIAHNVASLHMENSDEQYFTDVVVNDDNTLKVTMGTITFNNFYFDFTADFARCISYIEDAIFCTLHHMKVTDKNHHGITVKFKEPKVPKVRG